LIYALILRLRLSFLAAVLFPAIGVFVVAASEAREPPAAVLKIATFNVMWEERGMRAGNLTLPVWKVRKSPVIELIRRAALDVVGVQEASPEQQGDLATGLPDYTLVFHPAVNNTNPILFRTGRLHLLESGAFTLNDVPERAASNIGVRSATWLRLEDPNNGRTITVYNLHLDHRSRGPTRQISAVRLAEQMARETGSHVVTGDFNSDEASPTMRFFHGKIPLQNDAGLRIRNPRPLLDAYRFVHPETPARIMDLVLVSPDFTIRKAGRTPSGIASDHDIFWAEVSLD
jgi:endonuclease/exonuclease/phosphatase family metal-dependent hydrolase